MSDDPFKTIGIENTARMLAKALRPHDSNFKADDPVRWRRYTPFAVGTEEIAGLMDKPEKGEKR